MQKYVTIFSLYIMFTPTCFDIFLLSSGSVKNYYFAKLHNLLELKLLKLHVWVNILYTGKVYTPDQHTNNSSRIVSEAT